MSTIYLTQQSYTQNGILHMLDRNRRIKECPQRFQSMNEHFSLIVTCEERVYDQVIEGLCLRQLLVASFDEQKF